MGWDEVPVPPTVTMSCPGATVYGTPPTVTATVNQSATIVFYLDGTQVSSSSGTSASYTPGTRASVGTHTIQVVASNTNGSGSVTCSWVVNPPAPTVTMECPGSSRYECPPIFTANANEYGTITFYLDDNPVLTISGSTATYTPPVNTPVGNHIVRVVIINVNGEGSYSCYWSIIPPAPVITLVNPSDSLVIDLEGTERTFVASVNPATPLEFTIDMIPVTSTLIDESTASISCTQSSEGHNISVFAGDVYGSDTKKLELDCYGSMDRTRT